MRSLGVMLFLVILSFPIWWDFGKTEKPEGKFFKVNWVAPEGVAYYKGFASSSKEKLLKTPFSCKEFRVPPPLRAGEKQSIMIRYKLHTSPYNIYVEIFAFDIDGNYWNLELYNKEGV